MNARLRILVTRRAGDQCEYCHIRQSQDSLYGFHIEHIIARQHGGRAVESNLALACHHCNLHKGPNLAGVDPKTGRAVPLFNPREQNWSSHFAMRGASIVGLTPTGRATVDVLAMNSIPRVQIRAAR